MALMTQIETILFLRDIDLFQFCNSEELLSIAGIAKQSSFPAGTVIYDYNEPATALYCLVSGQVSLDRMHLSNEDISLPCAFGFRDILSGRLRDSKAVAGADCVVLAIETEDFFDLLANNIEIVKALFRKLSGAIEQQQKEGGVLR
jgi:CRP-like cAMP-binding protein